MNLGIELTDCAKTCYIVTRNINIKHKKKNNQLSLLVWMVFTELWHDTLHLNHRGQNDKIIAIEQWGE